MENGDLAIVGATDLASRMEMLAYWIWRGYTDPWSHEWVLNLVRQPSEDLPHGCPPKDDLCEIRRVFRALCWPNIRYTFHPRGADRFQTLRRTIELRSGDCDNALVAISTALHILGFKVGARIYSSTGHAWDHIAPTVGLPRERPTKTLVLETTGGPMGTPESATFGWEVPVRGVAAYRDYWFDLNGNTEGA